MLAPAGAVLMGLPSYGVKAIWLAVPALLGAMVLHAFLLFGRLITLDTGRWLRWSPFLCVGLLLTRFLYPAFFHFPMSVHELTLLMYLGRFALAVVLVLGWFVMLVKKAGTRVTERARVWTFHAVLCSGAVLVASLYPGDEPELEDIVLGVLLSSAVCVVLETRFWARRDAGTSGVTPSLRWNAVAVVAVSVLTLVLHVTGSPQRAVFRLFRGEFEQLAQRDSGPMGAFIGPWHVLGCAVKEGGEIYAYTNQGSGYYLSQPYSFGFLFKPGAAPPTEEGIGNLEPVGGGWFTFAQAPEDD